MQVTKVSPLKKEVIDEKLEKAESKRLEQLANLKLKSQKLAKHETYTEKEPEDVKKERIISNQTERIKSAEKKRSSFLEEKIEKSKKEFEKIEVLKKEKEIKQKTELLERLETKLRKGQENHAKVEDNNFEKFCNNFLFFLFSACLWKISWTS